MFGNWIKEEWRVFLEWSKSVFYWVVGLGGWCLCMLERVLVNWVETCCFWWFGVVGVLVRRIVLISWLRSLLLRGWKQHFRIPCTPFDPFQFLLLYFLGHKKKLEINCLTLGFVFSSIGSFFSLWEFTITVVLKNPCPNLYIGIKTIVVNLECV